VQVVSIHELEQVCKMGLSINIELFLLKEMKLETEQQNYCTTHNVELIKNGRMVIKQH